MAREVGYRPSRAQRSTLMLHEEPLGPDEIRRVLEVFYAVLWAGPRARSLAPLLKDLTEEQLGQVRTAAMHIYSRADQMQDEKRRARRNREATRREKRAKSGALAS